MQVSLLTELECQMWECQHCYAHHSSHLLRQRHGLALSGCGAKQCGKGLWLADSKLLVWCVTNRTYVISVALQYS